MALRRRKFACSLQWITSLIWIASLGVISSKAFEIYVPKSLSIGDLVFNASIGDSRHSKWIYTTDLFQSDSMSLDIFALNSTSGEIRLAKDRPCIGRGQQKTIALFVEVRTVNSLLSQNISRFKLDFILQNTGCNNRDSNFFTNLIKPSLGQQTWGGHKDFEISTSVSTLKSCASVGSCVVSIVDFIPNSISRYCRIKYNVRTLIGIKSVDPDNGYFKALPGFTSDPMSEHKIVSDIELQCEKSSNIHSGTFTLQLQIHDSLSGKVSAVLENKIRERRAPKNRHPTFNQKQYFATIPEEEPPGYIVPVNIVAYDQDEGEAGRLSYSLLAAKDGRSQLMFAMNPVTGQLNTTQKLDRETLHTHYFRVMVKDFGKPPQSAEAYLTIHISDINDNKPKFEYELYIKNVSENVGIGSNVLTVRANDEDQDMNGEIEYSIINQDGIGDVFEIDPQLGSITTRKALDREKNDFYRFLILATDSGKIENRQNATAVVEISVLDENDNRPQFDRALYEINVREDVDYSIQPVLAWINATDRDDGANGMVRYSITGGNSLNNFAIDPNTGALSVVGPLDYEQLQIYRLSIRAQDGGSPPKSNLTVVTIQVVDVNDNDPKFDMPAYQESVLENIPVGTTIMHIHAYDADMGQQGKLLYKILDASPDMPIVIEDGSIVTIGELDREQTSEYKFKVEVRDHGIPPRYATADVLITVRDVNDNAPIFNPKIYNEAVSEEAYPGYPVVNVMAKDADQDENGKITYKIVSGNERNSFSLTSQMSYGMISVARPLVYKQQSRYVLSVIATDGSFHDTATVYINVSDANLNQPYFIGTPYQFAIEEDAAVGSVVYNVTAIDMDSGENARIAYSILDNDAFHINPQTGEVVLKQALDREVIPSYMLSITATDHGRPPKTDTADIDVIVLDANDNAPKFQEPAYHGVVEEDALIGTSILTVHAMDVDVGLNSRIRYSIDESNVNFMIEPTVGIIRTAKELDRECMAIHEFMIYAIDRGSPAQTTSVLVTIEVIDKNDNAPQFDSSNMVFYVNENIPIGTVVGTIKAFDLDEGANAEIDYSISGGVDADSFLLTGQPSGDATLSTLVELDFESDRKEYNILVRARSLHLFSDAVVKIVVQDVNDNIPILKDFVILFNNYKDHFQSGFIGKIPAHDPDVGDKLKYRFIHGNQANLLHLDEDTGIMRLDARLNSDMPTNGTLIVSVTDGINEVRVTCRLYVRLVTEDMLTNSITVRLKNIRQAFFLSTPYELFVSALASVIQTTEENIYIIDVLDDTDAHHGEVVLNVSFSVLQKVEHGRDVFFSEQFLREKVYLQRSLLARLSLLEVLPFDDDLCIREPCLNFEECASALRFGNTSGFLSSDTMLFRPIRPVSTFFCKCPSGFTGMNLEYLCDTEVNLCYSNPCGGNGSCVQREGGYHCECLPGFTGSLCETEVLSTKYMVCPKDICRPPSSCIPLIRGGVRCELCSANGTCRDCAQLDNYNRYCELKVRSFTKGSYLMFPPLKQRHRFNVRLSFATKEKNGLIFYNGRYNEKHDFVALEIINGQVHFLFSLGSDITVVTSFIEHGVSDGEWREVFIEYLNRTVTLTVGESCDTEMSIRFGHDIGKYHCAGRATQVLEARCDDVTETCHRFLDLTGPFQLGGLPSTSTNNRVGNHNFVGCIRDFYIDGRFVDLNSFAFQNGTSDVCTQKRNFCNSNPCQNSGQCRDSWNDYSCTCIPGWTGKDCTQSVQPLDLPRKLSGQGFLRYTKEQHGLSDVRLPWFNALSFRTRQSNTTLMTIDLLMKRGGLDAFEEVVVEIINGYVLYVTSYQHIALYGSPVDDGEWHYLEVRWLIGEILVLLDYGQAQATDDLADDWISGSSVDQIVVGGKISIVQNHDVEEHVVFDGFVGCIQSVRVGNSLTIMLANREEHNVEVGCNVSDVCAKQTDVCPSNAGTCVNTFGVATCKCHPGRTGPNCEKICDRFNPCHRGSLRCVDTSDQPGYQCLCDKNYNGRYCEQSIEQTCPASWWATPICGPCNCPVNRGFNPNCNKTTGQCSCKMNHYRKGSACYPCDCYEFGSYGRSCDMSTGQCHCRSNVVGRQCDTCSSKSAEVTLRGCEVIYDSCPRSFKGRIWWERTGFNAVAVQDCPSNMVGKATRYCNETDGWDDPNLENCASVGFAELVDQLAALESKRLVINTFVSKGLVSRLSHAVNETESLNELDINITLQLLVHILRYESSQSGLNLTHTQNRNFIQHVADVAGSILSSKYITEWSKIDRKSNGTMLLTNALTAYVATLLRNMPHIFTQPFDAVHDNIVIGLDFIGMSSNLSYVPIPKFNNKVKNPDIFDLETKILLPMQGLRHRRSVPQFDGKFGSGVQMAYVSYIMYKTLGDVMPLNFDDTITRNSHYPTIVGSPVVMLTVLDRNEKVLKNLNGSVEIEFRQLHPNRSNPQCVGWSTTSSYWTASHCHMLADEEYVRCRCDQLSMFAVLVDVVSEQVIGHDRFKMDISTYVGLAAALLCFAIAFVVFCFVNVVDTNETNANTIHMNMVAMLFLANAIFLGGIDRADSKVACKIIAILLHLIFMCSQVWMFVDILHIYRRMTDVRDVNHGPMQFYYVMGYVIPGIFVSLAVGLNTDAYGCDSFCWLKLTESNFLIWSFAAPMCCFGALTIAMIIAAGCASCQGRSKHADADLSYLRYGLQAGSICVLLMLLAVSFAVLSVNYTQVASYRYLFIAFTCLEGIFIFVAYIVLSRETRRQLHYTWYKRKGRKDMDDMQRITRATTHSFHSSMDAGVDHYAVGKNSRTSSPSHSILKGSEYNREKQKRMAPTKSPVPGRSAPYPTTALMAAGKSGEYIGELHPQVFHDSDSESEMSTADRPDVDSASSHSSSEDDSCRDVQVRPSKKTISPKLANYQPVATASREPGKQLPSGAQFLSPSSKQECMPGPSGVTPQSGVPAHQSFIKHKESPKPRRPPFVPVLADSTSSGSDSDSEV